MNNQTSKVQLYIDHAYAMAYNQLTLLFFGDHLAAKHKYKSLNGLEAVHYYLVQKHSWEPGYVRSLSLTELLFLLSEEMHGWTLPDNVIAELKKRERYER